MSTSLMIARDTARRGLQLFVMLTLWGLLTHGTYAGSGDEPHYLAIAHSIAFDGDVDLANNYGAAEPLVGAGVLRPDAHVRTGQNGAARPVHDIGMALLFAPIVRVIVPLTDFLTTRIVPSSALQWVRLTPPILYRHLLSLVMACLAVVLAGLMFDAFLYLDATPLGAATMTALLILSPPLLVFSILFFTELLSALLAFAALSSIILNDAPGARRWWWIGCATGALFLVHARNIGLMLALSAIAAYYLRARASRRDAIAFSAGLALLVAVRTAMNVWFWGTFVSGPHAHPGSWRGPLAFGSEAMTRLLGLLVDQEYGLLMYAPVYVCGLVGAFAARTTRRSLTVTATLTTIAYVAVVICPLTNPYGVSGGWSPAARFLTPITPFLGVLVYRGLQTLPRKVSTLVIVLQITISAYAWQHPKLLWNDGDGRAAFCRDLGSVCDYLPSIAGR